MCQWNFGKHVPAFDFFMNLNLFVTNLKHGRYRMYSLKMFVCLNVSFYYKCTYESHLHLQIGLWLYSKQVNIIKVLDYINELFIVRHQYGVYKSGY